MTTEELRELFGSSYNQLIDSIQDTEQTAVTVLNQEPTEVNANEMYLERGVDIPLTSTVIQDVNTGTAINIPATESNPEMDREDIEDVDINQDEQDSDVETESILSAINSIGNEPEEDNPKYIPSNPDVLSIKEETLRFSGTEWFSAVKQKEVVLAGLGGIGSFTYFLLTRLDPSYIRIYDPDRIDYVNLAGQLYSKNMVGDYKIQGMTELGRTFSNYYNTFSYKSFWPGSSFGYPIMICGFDNMAARKDFYESWKKYISLHPDNEKEALFIDGRLTLNEFQVFALTGTDTYNMNRYEKEFLFDDSEVEEAACTMKQTSYCASMIGSIIVNIFVNFIANTTNPAIEYKVPFKTYYNSNLMYFSIEN